MDDLRRVLNSIPGTRILSDGAYDDGRWWVKLAIDGNHHLAWRVIQELGHVLNQISIEQRLPSRFYPVSPPPYMNGGPDEFLAWIVEASATTFMPSDCAKWIAGRLPRPIDDEAKWNL